jgi:Rab5 GDP/GTP exchange factor
LCVALPFVLLICTVDLSNETIDQLMDYVEKYLMTRIYRLVFCSYLTDDEDHDLAMQNRIRSLHWINAHLLDTALDELCDAVRDLVDNAITGTRK